MQNIHSQNTRNTGLMSLLLNIPVMEKLGLNADRLELDYRDTYNGYCSRCHFHS